MISPSRKSNKNINVSMISLILYTTRHFHCWLMFILGIFCSWSWLDGLLRLLYVRLRAYRYGGEVLVIGPWKNKVGSGLFILFMNLPLRLFYLHISIYSSSSILLDLCLVWVWAASQDFSLCLIPHCFCSCKIQMDTFNKYSPHWEFFRYYCWLVHAFTLGDQNSIKNISSASHQ